MAYNVKDFPLMLRNHARYANNVFKINHIDSTITTVYYNCILQNKAGLCFHLQRKGPPQYLPLLKSQNPKDSGRDPGGLSSNPAPTPCLSQETLYHPGQMTVQSFLEIFYPSLFFRVSGSCFCLLS